MVSIVRGKCDVLTNRWYFSKSTYDDAKLNLQRQSCDRFKIELRNVVLEENVTLTLKSLKATIGQNVILENGADLRLIQASGCEQN